MNLRKLLSGKKDGELVLIYSSSQYPIWEAERGYKKDGGILLELAQEACDCAETATVAAAVIKDRVVNGSENSHLRLRDSNVKASPKETDRKWGKSLSDRRRV